MRSETPCCRHGEHPGGATQGRARLVPGTVPQADQPRSAPRHPMSPACLLFSSSLLGPFPPPAPCVPEGQHEWQTRPHNVPRTEVAAS